MRLCFPHPVIPVGRVEADSSLPGEIRRYEPVRLGKGHGVRYQCTGGAEDRHGRANSQREGDERRHRETALPDQPANRQAEVPRQGFDKGRPVYIPHRLLLLRHAAKRDQRPPPRLLRAHPGPQVLLDLHLQVELEFLIELALERVPVKEGAKPQPKWA